MKKLSITAKITIWYTVFLVVIALGLIVLLMQAQYTQERNLAEREIVEVIVDVSEMIEDDGEDFIYDSDIEFYQNNTYISVYDEDGELIVGRRPASVAEFPPLSDKTSVVIEDVNGIDWYVYDSLFAQDDGQIWIRGMMKHVAHEKTSYFLLRFLLIALPGFVLLAVLGGRAITRRAFRPLRDIISTTEDIRADADVSRRIPLGENRDELYELTCSINGMFDSIEDVLDREKQFTSDVSHELRTPIAVIQSQSEFALGDEEYREKALKTINRQAKSMSSLVNRLLTLSRSDAGTLHIKHEYIDFSELLTDIVEQQQIAAEDENIEITADIRHGIYVNADEEMLIRIILNLISNAMKYGRTPAATEQPQTGTDAQAVEGSGSRPAGIIHVSLREENGFAACTVADEGPGIPEEEQSRIWDRFYQIERSRSSSDSSAGLGLSMVRALAKAMGGTVSLKSEEGQGAAFTVKLPLSHNE